jgi:hypothetical protein
MRKLTATLCLTLTMILGSVGCQTTSPSSYLKNEVRKPDFQRDMDAYKSGDYGNALREWKLLAEQREPTPS